MVSGHEFIKNVIDGSFIIWNEEHNFTLSDLADYEPLDRLKFLSRYYNFISALYAVLFRREDLEHLLFPVAFKHNDEVNRVIKSIETVIGQLKLSVPPIVENNLAEEIKKRLKDAGYE